MTAHGPISIQASTTPDDAAVEQLAGLLGRWNVAKVGEAPNPLFLRAVDANGRLRGGLAGRSWFGLFHIRLLWVRQDVRRQGIGTALVEAAEAEARARGCRQMYLDTFTFEAGPFYERLGFKIMARVEGDPHGLLFMVKPL